MLGENGGGHGYAVGDVNGDGREDLLCAVGWYERPEADVLAKPWKFHDETAAHDSSCPFLVVDLTGDGRNHIIWGKSHDYGHVGNDPGGKEPECMYYYTWDRDARKFTRHTISPPGGGVGIGMQIRIADLNADGRPDIAVSGKTGTWMLLNEGPKR